MTAVLAEDTVLQGRDAFGSPLACITSSSSKFADDTKLFGAVDDDTHQTFNATEGFTTSMSVVRNVADALNTSQISMYSF